MSVNYDAVVAGHLCLDVIPDLSGMAHSAFEKTFLPGRLLDIGPVTFCTGGPVSNTGLALHKLGVSTQLMGKVGDDILGRAVIEVVKTFDPHLADGMVVDPLVNTSYTIVINPPGVDRIFLHHPGANDTFSAADVPYERLAPARLFHFGYPPLMKLMYSDGGEQLTEIYRQAKATGITTSLDMALPDPASAAGKAAWPAILTAALPYVDLFLPSVEELIYMLRRSIYDELCQAAGSPNFLSLLTPELLSDLGQELLAKGVKIACIKLGDRGLYLRTADSATLADMGRLRLSDVTAWANLELWTACFQTTVVGTAGSGDATIAGFLSALLRGLSPEAAVTAAVAVGACNVEAADTLSGVRAWDDTLARIAAGWARHPLDLTAPGWRFDETHQLWRKM